jgi:signal transduction histidine kinase
LAGAGVVLGGIDVALILTSNHTDVRGAWAAVALIVGWGFIGAGLFAWDHRPNSSIGLLMAATGFAWLLGLLSASNVPALFTAGVLVGSVYVVTAIHMLLAAPYGLSPGDRRIVTVAYVLVTVGLLPLYLFTDPERVGCDGCPDNAILIEHNDTIVDGWGALVNVVGIGLLAAVLVSLVRRWRRATRPERRLFAPVYASGVALMIAVIGQLATQTATAEGAAAEVLFIVSVIPLALVPYLFLASFVRMRMAQGGAVRNLMTRLGEAPRPGGLRDAIADALEDPSLELVYWLPEAQSYVDFRGRAYALPEDDPGRAIHAVTRDGECVAAIIYDATLREAEPHVRAVGAAASLALQNERLDAELRAKVDELRRSRERMLRIGLDERRRLERDLHDGAQQRLVAMALSIRLARAKLNEDPIAADQLLESAGEELDSALEELREPARGIHPAVLTDRGLATALETLASRAPVPVELAELPEDRLPEAVELAAYFVVAEALTNVAKYAHATHAKVEVARANGRLVVEVEDDGIGGANPDNGTGLRGLADRIAVLEGRLEIDSETGRGTTVRAQIPCA